jgi:hypothetical protein
MAGGDGILSGPIDLDGPRRVPRTFPTVVAAPGLVVQDRASGVIAVVESCTAAAVMLRDHAGRRFSVRPLPGGFVVEGAACTLAPPLAPKEAPSQTASGSVAVRGQRARVAIGSRILVEGVHDAELVERVWGDDLRGEGVVVERLDGMDRLDDIIWDLEPGPQRRLGVLLDHLVEGSKESRAADAIRHPHVLVTGTPFVDVWQAIRPAAAGIDAWPEVPMGVPWKTGVLDALGIVAPPGEFWRHLLGTVRTYADLEPELVGAVEQLIDFVTTED